MSRESRKSSPGRTRKADTDPTRAIKPEILRQAQSIAREYTIVLQPHGRLGLVGGCLEFPTVWVDGKTAAKCFDRMREALALAVAVMLEAGQTPPIAATEERRSAQINIRLTAEEKLLLESAAKRRGFRGVSDFVRAAAMNQVRQIA